MKKVTIIGTGAVATHLCVALLEHTDELVNVPSRTLEGLPSDSDIYILAVSDSAIEAVSAAMPALGGIVAHTSGSISLQAIDTKHERRGVLYPLQTFTKGASLEYERIPFFIEGSDPDTTETLKNLALSVSPHVQEADSERRRRLHLASVLACNCAGYLWCLAADELEKTSLPFSTLQPLLEASVEKLRHLSPRQALTGPAARGDMEVVEKHLRMLEGTRAESIYRDISIAIRHDFNPK